MVVRRTILALMSNKLVSVGKIILLSALGAVAAPGIDPLFTSQQLFSSAALEGSGSAGIALPAGLDYGWINPALIYSSTKGARAAFSTGYGRDSLFDRHIVPVTAARVEGKGAIGGMYRYLSGNSGYTQHEAALNFSGELFDKVDVQGAVDFGVTLRYVWSFDKRFETQRFAVERYIIDSAGAETMLGVVDSISLQYRGDASSRIFSTDIGFYQPDIMPHLDFGLTVTNLAGYRWDNRRPVIDGVDSAAGDTVVGGDTSSLVVRHYRYLDETKKGSGGLASRYRTLTIGVAYRTGSEALRITLPVDLVLLGLFDRKMENTFVFRGGVVAALGDALTVRIGYAREPKTILEGITTFRNVNIISGGAGLNLGGGVFDFFFSNSGFGVSASYRL